MTGARKRKKRGNRLLTPKQAKKLIGKALKKGNEAFKLQKLKDIETKIKLFKPVIETLLDDTYLSSLDRFFARMAYSHLNILRNRLKRIAK